MDDGPNRQAKRPRRAAAAAEGRLPPEVFAAVGVYCCRSSLDALMCTSKQIRAVCSGLSKPWPTNRGCPLVERLCPDNGDIPEEPEDDDSWYDDYEERPEYKQWLAELQSMTPPTSWLTMLHDSPSPSFLSITNEGICIDFEENKYLKPPLLQVWSKEWGLMFQEDYPSPDSRPALTPPLGECGSQFVILPVLPHAEEPPGVRMIEMIPQSQEKKQIIQTFSLCDQAISNIKCVGGSDGSCLIFMDGSESAVKMCKISLEGELVVLTEPVQLASDPSRTGDVNTRRSSLAVDSRRGIIAFAYDFKDTFVNIYDMRRKVSVVVPVPEGAGCVRDAEFSPDGKTLAVAHFCSDSWDSALSLYDCDVERIEYIAERSPKLFHIKKGGLCSDIAFSPKGKMLSFQWCPSDDESTVFEGERVGMIDLAPLKDADDGSTISLEILSEIAQWEWFASS